MKNLKKLLDAVTCRTVRDSRIWIIWPEYCIIDIDIVVLHATNYFTSYIKILQITLKIINQSTIRKT